ncbi:MAG: VTT domain-containing protein [Ruminococcus sp.]|jgi:uncharacterized membrane protein YdjX (TVP38/TMEM64 family)|nr:VTT domain-containing protein [Ruminococcus sp.]
MIIFCAAFYLLNFSHLGTRGLIEAVTRYHPKSLFAGAVVIITLFGLKSLSMIFPMVVLVVASGIIFDNLAIAITVNFLGVLLQITIPYLIGRYAERDFVTGLLNKHKNLKKAQEFGLQNEIFISYFLRVINILPCDAVSMYFGATGISPKNYYLGSMLGILPGMIVTTIAGGAVTEPKSPQFIISIAVEVAFAIGSAIYYYFYKKRKKIAAK